MCLGIPMKITRIEGQMAEVASGKTMRGVNIGLLKGIKAGDYVIVHAGFAIEKVDHVRAMETLRILKEMEP